MPKAEPRHVKRENMNFPLIVSQRLLLLLIIFQFGCRSISRQIVGSELSGSNISEQLPADEVRALMPSKRFIKEYTDEGRIYHTTSEDALESIFQDGFRTSRVDDPDFTNPEQDHGSGLWATKEPDFALVSEDRRKGIYRTTLVLRIVPNQEFIVFDYSARKSHPFVQRLLMENNNNAADVMETLREKYGVQFIINHVNRPEVIVQDFGNIQHARSRIEVLKDLDALYMHSLTSRATEVDRYFLAAERIRDSLNRDLPSSYRLPDLQVFADSFAGYDALIVLHEKYNIRPKVDSLRTHIGIASSREVLVRSLNELTNQDLRDCVKGDSEFMKRAYEVNPRILERFISTVPLADERFVAKLATVYPKSGRPLTQDERQALIQNADRRTIRWIFFIAEKAGEPTTFPEFILNTRHAMSNAFIVDESDYLFALLRNLPSASVGELLDKILKTANDYPDANMFIIASLLKVGVHREEEEVIAKIKKKLLPASPSPDRGGLLSACALVLDKILKPIRVGR